MKLSKADESILQILEINGRTSNREVARQLNISEGMVRVRLKKMAENKAIRLGVVCDIFAMGYTSHAIVRIKAVAEQVQNVAARLTKLDNCKFVGLTLGSYDILVYVLGQSRPEILKIIDEYISSSEGVTAVDVREPIDSKRQRFDLTHIV